MRPTPRQLLKRGLFFLVAGPFVVRSALRVGWLARGRTVRELAGRLRDVPRWKVAALRRAAWLDGVAVRLLPLLPPYGYGRCLKRSLLLLDLWSRCGLAPRLHLGVKPPGEDPLQAHAWVSTGDPSLDRRTGPQGWEELWSG